MELATPVSSTEVSTNLNMMVYNMMSTGIIDITIRFVNRQFYANIKVLMFNYIYFFYLLISNILNTYFAATLLAMDPAFRQDGENVFARVNRR
jgi:hypothetical protein